MRKNAFTMVGDIDRCWLFAYRIPVGQLVDKTPKPLELVTHGEFAFINIVISELSHMRPLGLPALVGMHYWHVAYRTYVRFTPAGKPPIEGLYFLRSDADSAMMVTMGNLLTDFQFYHASVEVEASQNRLALNVKSEEAPGVARLDYDVAPTPAEGSPFRNLEEAKAFLKYKPAGIAVNKGAVDVLRITREESAWRPKLVHVEEQSFEFLKPFDATLEVCYEVEPIHYQWNRADRYPCS